MLYEGIVEQGTLELIRAFSADDALKDFRLVGGTALSLQIGYRKSIDIDLFTNKAFDATVLAEHIRKTYYPDRLQSIRNGVFSIIQGVKLDMLAHEYDWLTAPKEVQGVRMASLEDIAAMKLGAIVRSGKRLKDFVDVASLLEFRSLGEMTWAYAQKYPEGDEAIARHSLLYHQDIYFKERVELVKGKLNWQVIAERLRQAVVQPNKIFLEITIKEGHSQGRGRRM